LEPYLTLNEPIQDTSHLEMGSANRLTDQIHKAVLERLNLYFHKKVRCKRKSTSETAKYVLDPSEAEQLVENISSQFLSSLTGKHKELRMHANTVQGVTEALPEGSDPTSQGDFVKPTESTSVLVAEVSCEVMMKNQTTAQAYLTPLDEESYPVFDLQEWLSAETAKSRKSKLVCSNRQADHQASSTTTVTANRPTLRLTDGAARTYLSGKKFNSFQIKNRDFIDFLNQIGGGLVKNKGNGSEVKYFLPNFKSDRTLKPYKVFRIDFSHNGKTPMNPVALWKFFGFALEEAGLAHMEIELVP
jgi:anaerobic selenocysteine-containing dehydrogenase